MRRFYDLGGRCRQAEVMDQPGLSETLHRQALCGLERINRWSDSAGVLWPTVRELALRAAPRPLCLLDLACGGGDVPLRLWSRARQERLTLQVEGCDRSPGAVAHAERRAAEAGAGVRFGVLDALADPLPDRFDVLTCSLFLHHLTDEEAVGLLRRMAAAARRAVLVNDLSRGLPGLLLAYAGTRLLTRSPVVHTDGPLSVRAAFTPAEALALAGRAGLRGATVSRRWPCRFLLRWERA
jgi:SAM-dependent methyltransferase